MSGRRAHVVPTRSVECILGIADNWPIPQSVGIRSRSAYSSGPVEGHAIRIKMLKRQMYGRANFDLLRKRVVHHV